MREETVGLMIRALLLIADPMRTWTRIKEKRHGSGRVLLVEMLPLLIMTFAVQALGLIYLGKRQGQVQWLKKFPVGEAVVFEVMQVFLWLALIIAASWLVKNLSQTFHARHTFREALTLTGWSFSPLLLLSMADALTFISPWASYAVGIALSLAVLYHGIPVIMEPDPPQAFGLFLGSSIVLVLLSVLARLLFAFYVRGRFPEAERWLTEVGARFF